MKVEYSINETDFLTFQLFTASKSDVIRKRRRKSRLIFPVLYLVVASLMFGQGKVELSAGFLAFAIVWYFIYPLREKRLYIRNYSNHIRQNFSGKLGKNAVIHFENDQIIAKDEVNENKFRANRIAEVVETGAAVYIKVDSGQTFIVPRQHISDPQALTAILKGYADKFKFSYNNEPNWEWK